MKRLSLLGGILLLTSSQLFAEALNLTAGTMTSGGSLGVNYHAPNMGVYSSSNWTANASINFGYFVIDNLALTFDVGGGTQLQANATNQNLSVGINLFYAIDTGTMVRPYGQIGGFGQWMNPTGGSVWNLGVKPAIGLLVGLNEYVALDFGIQAALSFPVAYPPNPATVPTNSLTGNIGYVGVRGFF